MYEIKVWNFYSKSVILFTNSYWKIVSHNFCIYERLKFKHIFTFWSFLIEFERATDSVRRNQLLLLLNTLTVGFFMLHNVFWRLIAVVIPFHVDRRARYGHRPQVVRSVRRLLDVQLYQLLVSAVHIARLTHVRTAVVYLHVINLQRSDNFFAERLLPLREPA